MPAAQTALTHALELDPNNLNAVAAHLDLAWHKLDWRTAARDADRLQSINPNSEAALHEMVRYYGILGFPENALQAARSAVQLDPLSVGDRTNLASMLLHLGYNAEAVSAAQAAADLVVAALPTLCYVYARTGQFDRRAP